MKLTNVSAKPSMLLASLVFFTVAASAFAAGPPHVAVRPAGPFEIVFDYATDACAKDDIPDEGARAFRDSTGTVHLIDSHHINLAMLGSSLNNVKRACATIYENSGSADPSTFDDMGWLESFYTEDGKTIHALVSHDYHPGRHKIQCGVAGDQNNCWWSTITQAKSIDGGKTFQSPPPGVARWVAGAPYKFDAAHTGPVGAFVASNIIPYQGAYYAFVSVGGAHDQRVGDCLMRTNTLGDPRSWRAWDGKGYTVQFADPYTTPNLNPKDHVCEPVSPEALKGPVRSLLVLTGGRGFIATIEGSVPASDGSRAPAVMVSVSSDLIRWSEPQVVQTFTRYPEPGCRNSPRSYIYAYPAMLDPNSPGLNFDTAGSTAYVYMTRFHGCHTFDRDLVRFPVTIEVTQ